MIGMNLHERYAQGVPDVDLPAVLIFRHRDILTNPEPRQRKGDFAANHQVDGILQL